MQTLRILIIVLMIIPIYDALIAAVGIQMRQLPQSPLLLVAALVLFHCKCWFRLVRVSLVVNGRSLLLSHLVLFVGRLSFIFGTSFFTLIVFRHLLVARVVVTLLMRFSLYCYTTKLERLGVALRP